MLTPAQLHAGRVGRLVVGADTFDLTHVELGVLRVASGRLGASDPFVDLENALEFAVLPGDHRSTVTVADVSAELDGRHLREAYLSVWLVPHLPHEVARVAALVPVGRQVPDDEEFYGVAVDAGTVAFADVQAVQRCMPEDDWYEAIFDPDDGGGWFAVMDDPDHLRAGSANLPLPLATDGENLVLTHSGWGDGFYPVFGAYDDAGQLLAVHLDLQVLAEDEAQGDSGGQDTPGPADRRSEPPTPLTPPSPPVRGLLARLLRR